eukprot:212273_1
MAQMSNEEKKSDIMTTTAASTMKAIQCVEYGHPKDVLKLKDIPMIQPSDKELLIEVYSAALNPVDYKMVKGWLSLALKKSFPWTPGRDFAGRVVQIGKKVDKAKLKQKRIDIGTCVCGMISHFANDGTFAEYLCVEPQYCEPFSKDKLNFDQAASIPLASMTAYQAILRKGTMPQKGKVLILGGSSGCGVYGIQIAKLYGASEVTVTSSQEAFCKSLGADVVLNYKDKNIPPWYEALQGKNYDVIFDCVGGRDSWDEAHKVLKKDGSFVTIVGDEKYGQSTTLGKLSGQAASVINRKFWSLWKNPNYSNFLMNPTDGLGDILTGMQQGKLKPVLDDASPWKLENFMEMFEKQMSHQAHGKLVLQFKS